MDLMEEKGMAEKISRRDLIKRAVRAGLVV
jgi:hypothetical protein